MMEKSLFAFETLTEKIKEQEKPNKTKNEEVRLPNGMNFFF